MGLTYNGINLGYVLTERIEQESVRDPSGTDQLYTLFRISVRSIVAPYTDPAIGPELPAAAVARVRHMLLQPRQQLTYTAPDGTVLVSAGPSTDAANGPFPQHCSVSQVMQGSLIVDYMVECRLTDCTDGAGRPWASLRWSETVDQDELWRTSKRRSGTLVIKTGFDADAFRGLVTPGVPKGFRRESAHYSLSPDNLTVSFSFLDRELMRPAPFPAIRIRGRQVESTPLPGAVRHGEINLTLDGPKAVSPRDLLNAGIRIAIARANSSGVYVGPGGRMLIGGSIAESLNDDENRVELVLRWRMKPVAGRSGGKADAAVSSLGGVLLSGLSPVLGIANALAPPTQPNAQGRDMGGLPVGYAGWLGSDLPGSDPNRAIGGVTRGTAPDIRLIAAALNDPCGQTASVTQLEANLWAGQSQDGGTVELRAGSTSYQGTPDDQAALYADSTPGVYDHYRLCAIYKDDAGNAVCPSTKAGERAMEVKVCNSLLTVRLEWSVTRIGGPPVIPSLKPPDASNMVYLGGTIPIEHVDLAGDGVSLAYSSSGVADYAFLDSSIASIQAPIPPWLDLGPAVSEPSQLFAVASWPFPASGGGANPFTGAGVSLVGGAGGGGGGGPPVLP